ncbi:coagulation factor XI-like [Chelmon rostratus]|uniref:coagulation factor XI-like n=1 Tax=Chelmon rostratus TaxID=109905 RepID=UPI001BE7B491|nr:coagulation factor XI-like [Chelmon rostratus]
MRAHVIILGLLSLCGLSSSQECSPGFLENVVLLGREIEFLYSPDAEHCRLLCTHQPACRFFSFTRPDSGDEKRHFHCHLKSSSSGQPEGQTSQQGVTSGLSLKSCNTNSSRNKVYHSVDFYGADYRTLFTADYEECQRACTNDPSCQFFTFLNETFTPADYRYKCHLKFSWTVPRTTRIKKEAGLVAGFSQKIQMTLTQSETACRTQLFPNTVIPGNNLENLHAASPEHCLALCTAHPKCTYFSYASGDFTCHLKNNLNEMVVKARDGVTSGLPARFCQLDNSWIKETHAGVDFWGSDYHDVLADDAEACQRTCTEDPNCQFYTFVTDSSPALSHRGICYLKRVITVPAPPKVSKLAAVVSGFSLKNCVSSPPAPTTPTFEEAVTSFT